MKLRVPLYLLAASVVAIVAYFLSHRTGIETETATPSGAGSLLPNVSATTGGSAALPPDGVGRDGGFASAPARQPDDLVDEAPTAPASILGAAVSVWATVNGVTTRELTSAQNGEFPQVTLPRGGEATVRIRWSGAKAGDRLVAAVEDGGTLGAGKLVLPLNAGADGTVSFDFKASDEPGIFRVAIRRGPELRVVQFWASAETPLAIQTDGNRPAPSVSSSQ
jgi:hypothetical protein